ncbi:MAG: aspartate 1-decarboxylase, partial [Candidatus Pelagisphaera sp.]
QPGQKVIIASFVDVKESKIDKFRPKLVMVNEENEITVLKEPVIRRP